jgi:type IV secretory pathway VirB10-like protein
MTTNVNFIYETVGATSYLVATFPPNEAPINYQLQMISSNEIATLLPVVKRQKNDDIQIFYNITSKVAASQIIARRKMNKPEFITLLEGAIKGYKEVQEYQLIRAGILFDLQYIFVKTDTFEPSFVYLPIYSEENGIENLVGFIQNLILKSVVETTSDNFIQIILNTLNSEGLTIEQLEQCIRNIKGERDIIKNPASTPVPKPVEAVQPVPPVQPAPITPPLPERIQPAPTTVNRDKIAMPSAAEQKNTKKDDRKKEKVKEDREDGQEKKKKTFLLSQAIFMIIVASLISFGFFKDHETGTLLIKNLMAAVIVIGVAEFIVYREIFVNSKTKSKDKVKEDSNKKKSSKKESSKAKVEIPGKSNKKDPEEINIPSAPAAMPRPAAPAPIPTPVDPQPIPVSVPGYAAAANQQEMYIPSTSKAVDETVILDDQDSSEAYLEYYENGLMTRVMLNKPSVIIGRLAGQVDFVVNNNKVGKMHAEFIAQGGSVYVKDLNSKNGTYINGNGQRITNNVPYPIQNGDKITLANSDFKLHS